jgi:hypothetical protein
MLFDEVIDYGHHFGTDRSTQQSVEQSHGKTLLRLESAVWNQRSGIGASAELERKCQFKRKYKVGGAALLVCAAWLAALGRAL